LVAVNPLYYGLWFFNTCLAGSSRLVNVTIASTSNELVKVWAAQDTASHVVRICVIHKDMNSKDAASIQLDLADGRTLTGNATLTTLTAPSVTATNGVKFGGLTYDGTTDGKYTGKQVSSQVAPHTAHHGYDFVVAPTSMAILTLPLQ
jgi:hypothetical protein